MVSGKNAIDTLELRTPVPPSLSARSEAVDLSPQLLKQTKAEIGNQLQQLAELTRQSLSIPEFYSSFLSKSLSIMMAEGASVWQREEDGAWSCIAHCTSPGNESAFDELKFDGDLTEEHRKLLERVFEEGQPVVIPPASVSVLGDVPSNPTEQLLLYSPIPFQDSEKSLWLLVSRKPTGGVASHRGYLRFAAQLADLIADYLKSNRLHFLEQERGIVDASERLLDRISHQTPIDDCMRDLVDTLCGLAQANQVFLVHRKPSRPTQWKVETASGIGKIDDRGEGAETIVEFCRFAEGFPFEKGESGTSFSISQRTLNPALENYFDLFAAKKVSFLPLDVADSLRLNSYAASDSNRKFTSAVLIAHWPSDIPANPIQNQTRIEKNLVLLSRIVLNALRPSWWKCLVRTSQKQQTSAIIPWRWPRWVQWSAALTSLGLIGCIPVPWSLHTTATLHPSKVEYLYAPSDSIVQEVFADHNDELQLGAPILRLQDRSLETSLEEAIGIQAKQFERIREVSNRIARNEQLTAIERDQLEGERVTLDQAVQTQQKRIQLMEEQQKGLELKASSTSRVGTWDMKRTLLRRPVRAGQLLATLYEENESWYLEASFPERDWALLADLQTSGMEANVSLASHPGHSLRAKLLHVDQQASLDPSDPSKRVLRLRFEIPSQQLPQKKEGTTAQITIPCGHSPLAWVLFRDILLTNFARLRLWL